MSIKPKHLQFVRRKPMKRTGFARPVYERAPVPPLVPGQVKGTVKAAIAVMLADAESHPFPKFDYVRDERIRDGCRAIACQRCGARGASAGVTWAHSNWAVHGKGGSVKASDVFVAAMCWACHRMLDQGSEYSEAQKQRIWWQAHVSTLVMMAKLRLWPKDVAMPDIDTYPF